MAGSFTRKTGVIDPYTHPVNKGRVTVAGKPADDLPGCIATGATREEVERLNREAIEFHLERMRQDGEPFPERRPLSSI